MVTVTIEPDPTEQPDNIAPNAVSSSSSSSSSSPSPPPLQPSPETATNAAVATTSGSIVPEQAEITAVAKAHADLLPIEENFQQALGKARALMDNGEDFSQSAYSFSTEVSMLRNQVASLETDKMIFGVALEQSIEKINELRAEISGEKDLERFHEVVTATKEAAVAAGIKLDAWLHGGPDRGSEVPPPRISDSTMMSAASMASKSDAASWKPATCCCSTGARVTRRSVPSARASRHL